MDKFLEIIPFAAPSSLAATIAERVTREIDGDLVSVKWLHDMNYLAVPIEIDYAPGAMAALLLRVLQSSQNSEFWISLIDDFDGLPTIAVYGAGYR
jgi:hypothetical protein